MSVAIHIHRDLDDDAKPIPYHIEANGHTDAAIGQHYWFTLSTGHTYVTVHCGSLDELYQLGRELVAEAMRLDTRPALDLTDAQDDVFAPTPEAVS